MADAGALIEARAPVGVLDKLDVGVPKRFPAGYFTSDRLTIVEDETSAKQQRKLCYTTLLVFGIRSARLILH